MAEQLIKKTEEGYSNVIPKSWIEAITEKQHDDYMKVIEEKMEAEMRLKREEVSNAQEQRCQAV